MASSGYTAITFVANEQPTTAKWNLIGSNDSSFNLGTGLEDGVIGNRQIAASAIKNTAIDTADFLTNGITWTTPTFQNGWADYALGYDATAYGIDKFGVVHIKGLVKNGTADTAIFTLPAPLRPSGTRMWVIASGSASSRIDVSADGIVKTTGAGAGGVIYTALNLSYRL